MTCGKRIMALFALEPTSSLSPADCVDRLGLSEWTVSKAMYRLRLSGQLERSSHGCYHLPGVTPSPPVSRRSLRDRVVTLEQRVAKLEIQVRG